MTVALQIHFVFRDHPVPPIEFLLQGGDPFTDLAPHDLDWMRAVLKEDPVEVYAVASASMPELKKHDVMDTAFLVLSFASGTRVTMEMSRTSSYGYDQRAEVFGDKGVLLVDNPRRTAAVLTNETGSAVDQLEHSFPQRFSLAFEREVDEFARVIAGGECIVTREDAVRAQVIAIAASQSFKEGRPIKIEY